jgi:hypothetical protein
MMLLVYTTTAVGLPLPLGGKSLIHGEGDYPCAAGACGCRSAEQCWTSCCCHTLAERLAWAKRRGIRPPREAIDQARKQALDTRWLDRAQGSAAARPNCCAAEAGGAEKCGAPDASTCAAIDETSTSDYAVVMSALRCQGKSINWLAAVVQTVDLQPVATSDASVVGQLAPPALCLVFSCEAAPPVPPPEAVQLG